MQEETSSTSNFNCLIPHAKRILSLTSNSLQSSYFIKFRVHCVSFVWSNSIWSERGILILDRSAEHFQVRLMVTPGRTSSLSCYRDLLVRLFPAAAAHRSRTNYKSVRDGIDEEHRSGVHHVWVYSRTDTGEVIFILISGADRLRCCGGIC